MHWSANYTHRYVLLQGEQLPVEDWSRRKLAAHAFALAVSLSVLAAGAVAASRFTSAYWVQVSTTM